MSAFVVSPEHIKELAAFAVSKEHGSMRVGPRYLVYHVSDKLKLQLSESETMTDDETATIYAGVLYSENIRSVWHRYPDDKTIADLPGLIDKPEFITVTTEDLHRRKVTDPVHILKMANCLDYQSCESDDWRQTDAYQILLSIKESAIRSLPGYDSAPWEFDGELPKPPKEEKPVDTAKTKEELPAAFPYLVPAAKALKKSGHALGASNIKKDLQRAFPGIKFSVKSDSFSGGDSIHVAWTDGPTGKDIDNVIDKYEEGTFNGMEDIYEYNKDSSFPDTFGGAKYVSGQRGYSPAAYVWAMAQVAKEYGVGAPPVTLHQFTWKGKKDPVSAYLDHGSDFPIPGTHGYGDDYFSSKVNVRLSKTDFREVDLLGITIPAEVERDTLFNIADLMTAPADHKPETVTVPVVSSRADEALRKMGLL